VRETPRSSCQVSPGQDCNSGHIEVSLKLAHLAQMRLLSLRRVGFA